MAEIDGDFMSIEKKNKTKKKHASNTSLGFKKSNF